MERRWWVSVWAVTERGERLVKETEYKTYAGAVRGEEKARAKYEGPPINWTVRRTAGMLVPELNDLFS
jgi:hypothetical protein